MSIVVVYLDSVITIYIYNKGKHGRTQAKKKQILVQSVYCMSPEVLAHAEV